jgi:hypothetical protein
MEINSSGNENSQIVILLIISLLCKQVGVRNLL